MKPTVAEVIDTEGVAVGDVPDAELPTYSVLKAIEWVKRPENDARIRQFAARAAQAQDSFVKKVDDEVTKVGRLLVEIGTNDDVKEDVINHFLSTLIGE